MCQVGEAAQLRRYLPAQGVVAEVQLCQVGEAAQFRRYLPAKGVWCRGTALSGSERLPNSGGISPLKKVVAEVQHYNCARRRWW